MDIGRHYGSSVEPRPSYEAAGLCEICGAVITHGTTHWVQVTIWAESGGKRLKTSPRTPTGVVRCRSCIDGPTPQEALF